jgi:NADH-quinone oxidoreductase subunit L
MSNTQLTWVIWAVLLPLGGILINLVIGRRLGEKGIGAVASLAVGGSFIFSVMLALALLQHPEGGVYRLATWFDLGRLAVDWSFRVDTLSVTMMLAVSGVSTLIHIYSIGYMHADVRHNGDPARFRRFFVYLNLFVAAMLLLVSANNFLVLFVGWEGVGLCSYLLIGFWFEKGEAGLGNARAAKKAFIVNRVGDFGMLIAIFLMVGAFGTLDFDGVFSQAAQAAPAVLLAITLFMLLGVTGKSAQLPLFVWLPDAMAGPTPVSALIHAATMVTAGVYLVARSQALFLPVPQAQAVVTWVGGLTALFAASIALGQNDIKKVLAYSTISQLGFMVAAVGMGAAVAGVFHLVTHAFFKALLFLAAGSVILALEHGHEHTGEEHTPFDPQDMRQMGGLRKRMPLTFAVYLVGALALAGVAPLAGFFSKDEILVSASERFPVVFGLLLAAAFLTAFYMGRQLILVFWGAPRSAAAQHAGESRPLVTTPLVVLAVLSVLGGALNLPGVHSLEHWLEHSLVGVEQGHFVWAVAVGSLLVALFGLWLAWVVYGRRVAGEQDALERPLGPLYRALQRKWWVDEFYRLVLLRPLEWLAQVLSGPVDLGLINGLGDGLGQGAQLSARWLRRLQNGLVRSYALVVMMGVVAIFAYLLWMR